MPSTVEKTARPIQLPSEAKAREKQYPRTRRPSSRWRYKLTARLASDRGRSSTPTPFTLLPGIGKRETGFGRSRVELTVGRSCGHTNHVTEQFILAPLAANLHEQLVAVALCVLPCLFLFFLPLGILGGLAGRSKADSRSSVFAENVVSSKSGLNIVVLLREWLLASPCFVLDHCSNLLYRVKVRKYMHFPYMNHH